MHSFVDSLVLNSRAGYPYGAAEVFSLMQHMGCEPDRASFNIMVDAYGRAGLYEGKRSCLAFRYADITIVISVTRPNWGSFFPRKHISSSLACFSRYYWSHIS